MIDRRPNILRRTLSYVPANSRKEIYSGYRILIKHIEGCIYHILIIPIKESFVKRLSIFSERIAWNREYKWHLVYKIRSDIQNLRQPFRISSAISKSALFFFNDSIGATIKERTLLAEAGTNTIPLVSANRILI